MAAPDGETAGAELGVLLPDRDITVGGESITVRAFLIREAFRLWPIAHPIVEAMAEVIDEAQAAGRITYNHILEAVARYPDQFLRLVSESCGRPAEWIEGLSVSDGDLLLATFWEVNRDFFTRRLTLRRGTMIRRGETPAPEAEPAPDTSESGQP